MAASARTVEILFKKYRRAHSLAERSIFSKRAKVSFANRWAESDRLFELFMFALNKLWDDCRRRGKKMPRFKLK